jgi:CHAD domain-containing protein
MRTHGFVFVEQPDMESWLSHLVRSDNWRREPVSEDSITYFDTFDWRLYRKEQTLALDETKGRQFLQCRTFAGDLLSELDPAVEPGFAWDLPPGPLRRQLQPLVKMRRLLPRVTLHSRQHRLALLNSDGKTVLRLLAETDRMVIGLRQGALHPLPAQLRLLPVRGYLSEPRRLEDRFRSDAALRPSEQNSLEEAMIAVGRRPADYTSKLELQLQPEQDAQQALRTILSTLLEVLKANLDGLRADIDTEFLHDFRVAVRRTRSALGQLKGLLPPAELAPFREDFTWLGTITGPTRDLDVYLLKFGDYCGLLPELPSSDFEPFHHFLEQRRNQELQALVAELDSPRFAGLFSEWQAFLELDREPDPALPAAGLLVREVADRRTWKLFRRCLKEGRAITPESPAEELHELRKTCKKLRYLLEFFQSLHPPEAVASLIEALKGLQDNLGEIQDFEVQSEATRTLGREMAERDLAPSATLLAMGMLSESLRQRQHRAREEFYSRFEDFHQIENRRLFRHLFGRPKKGACDQ